MKVKITEHSVTFKITEGEMNVLAAGGTLENKISVGGNDLAMVIDSNSSEFFDAHEEKPLKLILDRKESCLMLFTSKDQIEKLVDMGRSKGGISTCIEGLQIILQVDLRSDQRPLRKG